MGRIRKIKNADILIKNYHWLLQKASDHYFNNSHQLYIEVGSGKGDFIIQNALKYPDINFIGIEKDKTIVLKILRKIDTLSIKPINLLIICDDAKNLLVWFKINSISKIFLNFSDPWPKKRHEKYRLTSKLFLDLYHSLLIDDGRIEFKTDNEEFYFYSLQSLDSSKQFKIIYQTQNLYLNKKELVSNIQTEYEKKFVALNKPIYKIVIKSN